MASVKRRGKAWNVRWKELHVTVDDAGATVRTWVTRQRSAPTEAAAKQLARDIENEAALGRKWTPAAEQPVARLRAIALGFVKAARDAGAARKTLAYRVSMVGSFLTFMKAFEDTDPGAMTLVDVLSLDLLEQYAASLPGDGRQAHTRHRKVSEVERMWRWAADRPEKFPGVPTPRRYTGGKNEADKLRAPPPVIALAAPTWSDVDAMLAELATDWHHRLGVLMRFTGLRVSQAVGLGWRDVDLVRGILRVRAGVEGAKRSATRVVPIHAELAERMATWPLGDDGLVFPLAAPHPGRVRRGQASDGERVLRRAEYARNAYRRAWEAAGVAPEKWDVIEGDDDVAGARAHGSPCHAFRRCIRVELIRMGVEEAIALYLVGQTQGITAAAYVPEDDPESSPYWPRLVDAVSRIPRIGQARPSTPSANNTPELV